ncbi:MAG: molybdopterin-dependent oxidoreductase, partial [Caulobacteraceae bacterium]
LGFRKHFNPASQDTVSRSVANYVLYGSLEANGIPDLDGCELLLVFGANPLVSHGSYLITPRIREDLDGIAERGEVVVFDPRRTETAERYSHVPLTPASDVWVLGALVSEVFRSGAADDAFLRGHTRGARDLAAAVSPITPEVAQERSGVAAETIRSLARRFTRTASAAYGRVGLCRGPYSTLANLLLDALNIVGGRFAKPGGWVFGYSPLGAPKAAGPRGYGATRSRIADLPTVGGVMPSALMSDEILEPGEGRVRALFCMAGNPALSTPGGARLAQALASLDLFVASDFYVNETNRYADFVLPATTFLERADVITLPLANMLRPFMQFSSAVSLPRGEARHELETYQAIAENVLRRQGREPPVWTDPFELFDKALEAGDSDLTLASLKTNPHGVMLDRTLLFEGWQERMAYPDGRIRLWHELIAGEFARLASEPGSPKGQLRLFGRRDLKSMNSWMHNVDRLVRRGAPALEMHPADAAERGLRDGATVEISGAGQRIVATLQVTEAVAPGSICYPHGWGHAGSWRTANSVGGANVNAIAPSSPQDAEAVSGASFLDGIPVEVVAATAPAEAHISGTQSSC